MDSIILGQKYIETTTGLIGVATAKAEWLDGTTTVLLQPPMNKDGAVPEVRWVNIKLLGIL